MFEPSSLVTDRVWPPLFALHCSIEGAMCKMSHSQLVKHLRFGLVGLRGFWGLETRSTNLHKRLDVLGLWLGIHETCLDLDLRPMTQNDLLLLFQTSLKHSLLTFEWRPRRVQNESFYDVLLGLSSDVGAVVEWRALDGCVALESSRGPPRYHHWLHLLCGTPCFGHQTFTTEAVVCRFHDKTWC